MPDEVEGESHQERYAHYCAQCALTLKLLTTADGPVIGCRSGCHRRSLDAVAAGDLPEDWQRETSPFELRGD